MKVLVTGATGFIGKHLTRTLESRGIKFVVLGRNATMENGVQVDLLKTESFYEILSKIKPTHLIHLAWYAEHGKFWNATINVKWISATFKLIEAFYKNGGEHALITGTCAEYDWFHGYCVENVTPERPHTLYGEAKHATHRLVELLKFQHGMTLTWARIFFPYGIGEAQGRLIPSLFRVFRESNAPFGVNANSYRDFLHISDTIEALLLCTIKKIDGIINISSGEPVQIKHIVKEIATICNANPEKLLSCESARMNDPTFLVGNNHKLLSYGWQQHVSLRKGLLTYYDGK